MERLHKANDLIEVNNLEGALVEFSKIIFYDKNSKLVPSLPPTPTDPTYPF